LAIIKGNLEFKKKAHQEQTELFKKLIEKVDDLTEIMRSIAPQYLE